jgi:hypothetical protein
VDTPDDGIANAPSRRHGRAMKTTVELDAANRIVLSRELRRAAGIPPLLARF